MNKYVYLVLAVLLSSISSLAQSKDLIPVEIEEKQENNRLILYAVNKNLVDLDVEIKVTGTQFRQRGGRQMKYRVPARSKAPVSTLIVDRGKQALYKYELTVNDSLSRRVIRPAFELIRVNPKKKITLFLPDSCTVKCDTLITGLNKSPYIFESIKIADDQNVKTQISKALVGGQERLDTLSTPIVMLGGKMYLKIKDYEELMVKMEEE